MSHWNIWLSTFRYRRVVVVDDGSFCIIDFRHITKHQDVAPMPSSTFFYATKKWSSHKCQSLLKSHNVSFLSYKDIAYDLDHKCIHCKECSFVYFSDKSEQMVAKKRSNRGLKCIWPNRVVERRLLSRTISLCGSCLHVAVRDAATTKMQLELMSASVLKTSSLGTAFY